MRLRGTLLVMAALAGAPAAAQTPQPCNFPAAEAALERAQFAEALAQFNRCFDAAPTLREKIRAELGRARTFYAMRDFEKAQAHLDSARAAALQAFGPGDIALAGIHQLAGLLKLVRDNDRAGAQRELAEAARIRNEKVRAFAPATGPDRTVQHVASGVVLPGALDGFEQVSRTIHDDEGLDVSVGYRRSGAAGAIVLTLYIYRHGETAFDALWEREVHVLRRLNPQAFADAPRAFAFSSDARRRPARSMALRYGTPEGAMTTRLYLVLTAKDAVKLRVTHRADDDAEAERSIQALLEGIGWPP